MLSLDYRFNLCRTQDFDRSFPSFKASLVLRCSVVIDGDVFSSFSRAAKWWSFKDEKSRYFTEIFKAYWREMTNLLTRIKFYRRTSTALHRFIFTETSLRKSHYEILNIPSSASQKEIRDAYIEKSKVCNKECLCWMCTLRRSRVSLNSPPA